MKKFMENCMEIIVDVYLNIMSFRGLVGFVRIPGYPIPALILGFFI